MPRSANPTVPEPIFREPTFNEKNQSVVPSAFLTAHPSDKALYNSLGDLLKKDVVSFDKSRIADGQMVSLSDAYGSHGPQLIKQIKSAGKIIFHALGDSGASNARKYKNEITVADQLTADCHASDQSNQPVFAFHLGDVVYDFG